MSFGWSATDVANLIGLAWRTYQGARTACGAYAELTYETRNLHVILGQLGKECKDPSSLINRPGHTYRKEIEEIVTGCEHTLKCLNRMLEKYNSLSEKERSARKMFQSIEFGNKTISLNSVRTKITSYTSEMGLYLNLVSLGSMGRVEITMEQAGEDLKELKSEVNSIAATLSVREGSVLSSHTNDDKAVWKEFRSKLIIQGFKSSQLRKYEVTIRSYLTELCDRGVLDEREDIVALVNKEYSRGDPEEPSSTDLEEMETLNSYNHHHTENQRANSFSSQYHNSDLSSDIKTKSETRTNGSQATESVDSDEIENVHTSEIKK